MEARFILNNSLIGLNEDLYFVNDLMSKPKPSDIHLGQLEYAFQNLTPRVNQFFLDYKSTSKSYNETKEIMENLNFKLTMGIKFLEMGSKIEASTSTFAYMNQKSWSHIDFSRVLSKGLYEINNPFQGTPEDFKTPLNKTEELLCQPITILKNNDECSSTQQSIPEAITSIISDAMPVNQQSSQIEPNQNLERVKILCANQNILFRSDSMNLVAKIRDENKFSKALGIVLDKLGDNYKIDRFIINNLLSKKTSLEKDWECKAYLFQTQIERNDIDVYTFSCFIKCAGEHMHYKEARSAFDIAKKNPYFLNSFTYFAIIIAAIDNNELQEAKDFIKEASEKGILNDYTRKTISGKLIASSKKLL